MLWAVIGDGVNGSLLIPSHEKWRIAWMKWQKEMCYIFVILEIMPVVLRKGPMKNVMMV